MTFKIDKHLPMASALAAMSAVLQLFHLGFQSPQWGMWLDFVAVSWIIAFFLMGPKSAFSVSALGFLVITLFAPETWLGASMKWLATTPIWLSLFIYLKLIKKTRKYYQKPLNLAIPVLFGLVLRSIIVLPTNYYYAIPIWTNLSPQQAINLIPWYIIVGFNTAQTLIDVIFAWVLVFRFRLNRYAVNL